MATTGTRQSEQYGHVRLDFVVAGGNGFVILPGGDTDASGQPWVWYAPTFVGGETPLPKALHAWYMERLLGAGIAVAGTDVGESWGSPSGRRGYTRFHDVVVDEFGLAEKACLFAQSRGGLMHYNWAAEHAERVQCIGAVYPVCDVTWPMRLDTVSAAYGMAAEELTAHGPEHNPLDRLEPLACAGIPILHVHGDADDVVPLESNSAELARRYRRLGGPMELVVIGGKGHEEVREYFECPALLEFFLSQGASVSGG